MALSRRPGRRSRLTLVLLVLTSITVLTLDFRGSGPVREIREAASTAFSPIRSAADTVFRPIGDAWNGAFHYDDVENENEQLRKELDDLRAQAATNDDARRQLEELQTQLKLPVLATIPHVEARITSGPLTNFDHTIEISKGANDGIKVNMPVVAGGLVGRVVQVTADRSIIKLVTDPDFQVGVKLAASQDIGLSRGQGDNSPLQITGIQPTTEVPNGDVVTTSGQSDSYFPPDIPVGAVTRAEKTADQLQQILTVETTVDFSRLSYVSVLLYGGGG